ncbi:hypothetical protein GQ607_014887 [Colletotrichum asianum]|uniref:F-box domain-containing protein n=1 Tax=Colletotrichum asianum TaxID=702518 RepID=A0A8H3VYN2_9PEZI|nr:hypothetical protein GQ607_014887 [Colletotrichum asianum]
MFENPTAPTLVEFFATVLVIFLIRVAWEFYEFCVYDWFPYLKEDAARQHYAQERPAYVSPRILSNKSLNNNRLQFATRINTGISSHDNPSVDKRNTKATCGSMKNTDSANVTTSSPSLLIKPLVLVPETRHPSLFKMPVLPIEKPFASKSQGDAPKLSSWEVAFDDNMRRSRVLQLPDLLLLQIMYLTAIDDLYMLRQVSFTFWHLYQGPEFDKFYRRYWQLSATLLHSSDSDEEDKDEDEDDDNDDNDDNNRSDGDDDGGDDDIDGGGVIRV